jgi:ubiquinone/menaquinone biosynthesis C-methylase UbiE
VSIESSAQITRSGASPIRPRIELAEVFDDEVVQLKYGNDHMFAFAGHFDPQDPGITKQFLENAEIYDSRYYNPDALAQQLKLTLSRAGLPDLVPRRVLDVGSGSGNSVFALGHLYPSADIVASDLSPAMIRIMQLRAATLPAIEPRLTLVVGNAAELHPKEHGFDLLVGSSMLHHLVDPFGALKRLLRGVRHGGAAIFYEPFQAGNIVFRACLNEIMRRARSEGGLSEQHFHFYRTLTMGVDLLCKADRSDPIYGKLDDKWMFNRRHFEEAARESGCRGLRIYSTNPPQHTFRNKLHKLHMVGLGETVELPSWIIEILDSCDKSISPALREELLMEGSIIFLK